jgi:outer membrane protein assembly factor BamB
LVGIDAESCEILWDVKVETAIGAAYPTPVLHGDGLFLSLYGRKSVFYRVTQDEAGGYRAEEAWDNPAKGYMSTPVVVGGHAYVQLTNRLITCINMETGEEAWRSSERFGIYWNMVVGGDKILALDGDGTLRLLRVNPSALEILDERKVSETMAWAHLAVADRECSYGTLRGSRSTSGSDAVRRSLRGRSHGPVDPALRQDREGLCREAAGRSADRGAHPGCVGGRAFGCERRRGRRVV